MGTFTVTKWQCDRCAAIFDEKPKVDLRNSLVASRHGDFSGGRVIAWEELCYTCNNVVGEIIVSLIKDAEGL